LILHENLVRLPFAQKLIPTPKSPSIHFSLPPFGLDVFSVFVADGGGANGIHIENSFNISDRWAFLKIRRLLPG
jgi:hypothetical protein